MTFGEDFEEIGTLEPGRLTLFLPGFNYHCYYSRSQILVRAGTCLVPLNMTGYECEETTFRINGPFQDDAARLLKELTDPILKGIREYVLTESPHNIFYSKADPGIDVITLPSEGWEDRIETGNYPNTILALYYAEGKYKTAEKAFWFHREAIDVRPCIVDERMLLEEVLKIPAKIQEIYRIASEELQEEEYNLMMQTLVSGTLH